MFDERLMTQYAGHSHGRHDTTPVLELEGVPVAVNVDTSATLWVCDLAAGECTRRPLDLASAGPDEAWYHEVGEWDEDWDEEEDGERPRWEADEYEIASELTVVHLDGRPLVVTGGGRFDLSGPELETMGGAVRLWDPHTGRQVGGTLTGHELGVTGLAALHCDAGPLLVSNSEEGRLIVRKPGTGEQVMTAEVSYNGDLGTGFLDGRPVVVPSGHGDFVQVWDLLSGQQWGPSLTGAKPVPRAMAAVEADGRRIVAAGGDEHVLQRWDLDTGEPLGEPLAGHTDRISTMGTARVAGRTLAVTGGNDGTSRVWDLAAGRQLGAPLPGHLQTVTEISGTPVAVTSSREDGLYVWDLGRAVG